jgi:hypothetical protein
LLDIKRLPQLASPLLVIRVLQQVIAAHFHRGQALSDKIENHHFAVCDAREYDRVIDR